MLYIFIILLSFILSHFWLWQEPKVSQSWISWNLSESFRESFESRDIWRKKEIELIYKRSSESLRKISKKSTLEWSIFKKEFTRELHRHILKERAEIQREVGNSKSIYLEVKGGGFGLEDPKPVGACCSMRIITYVISYLFYINISYIN